MKQVAEFFALTLGLAFTLVCLGIFLVIAIQRQVSFTEPNPLILYGEIVTVLATSTLLVRMLVEMKGRRSIGH